MRPLAILATCNEGKRREYQELMPEFELIRTLRVVYPEEGTESFRENALAKARACFERTGIPSFGDDSGLCVEALGGAPGIMSARYAGEGATDAQNVARLAHEMRFFDSTKRSAKFITALAYVAANGDEVVVRGVTYGSIPFGSRGTGGFGYDGLFVPHGDPAERTFAQMTSGEKAEFSHRAQAVNAMRQVLR